MAKNHLTQTFEQLAEKYFGIGYIGLNCDRCNYIDFLVWYNNTHTSACTPEIYALATYVWTTCVRCIDIE